jgi:hypothetical protein
MTIAYKVLGQSAPTTTSNTTLYTVPVGRSAVASSLTITNTTSGLPTCRIFIRIASAAAATSNALVYDTIIQANDLNPLTIGLTLSAGDVITVQSSIANALTFQLFGSEIY